MNVLLVLLDSLNFHSVGAYGSRVARTPNMDRLATRATLFDNHFVNSMPCMPARRDLLTGHAGFLWRGWGHVEPWDQNLAVQAEARGYVTQMVTDHYHYWEDSAHGYFEKFHGMEFVRGHEVDLWDTAPISETPEWVRSIDRHRDFSWRQRPGWGSLFYSNARHYETDESLFPCAQVVQRSADWLSKNRDHKNWLLWTEAFDPHEPFFLPEPYRTMYSPDGKDHPEFSCWPPYQNLRQTKAYLEQASELELEWVRAQYYGKVTMADHWLGTLLDRMDALDVWKDTVVIFTSDHGHELCEDRSMLSPFAKNYPHREAHSRIPLMIAHPDIQGGKRVSALTSTVDVNATMREVMGDTSSQKAHGRSLLPLVRGETASHRDHVLLGTFGHGVTMATQDWMLAQGCRSDAPLFWYSSTGQVVSPDMTSGKFIPGVDIPQWRVPQVGADHPDFLWRRKPFSTTPENLLDAEPGVARRMRDQLRAALEAAGCPPEQFIRFNLLP